MVESLDCAANVTLGSSNTVFKYDRYTFADGSIMATCYIRNATALFSNVIFYKKGQPGSGTAACFLVYDVDAPSGGYWNFDSIGSTAHAAYGDSSSATNGKSVTFLCNPH